MTALLNFDHVDSGYGKIKALHKVCMRVEEGEIVTLIGSNGAGKSTLLGTLFKNPAPWAGKITFLGKDLGPLQTYQIAPLGIALVPEGRRIFSAMTVMENLKMGTVPIGPQYEQEDLEKVFKFFPRLFERKQQRAGTLSGGEQQMLAIGRALMSRPRLLLLDEPSLGLAPLIVKQIFQILSDIAAMGTTVFLVEQNANQALHLADRAYVLVNGRITMEGTGKELLANPEIKKAYLGE